MASEVGDAALVALSMRVVETAHREHVSYIASRGKELSGHVI